MRNFHPFSIAQLCLIFLFKFSDREYLMLINVFKNNNRYKKPRPIKQIWQ